MIHERIYLDYAATTPLDKKILELMLPYFSEKYGNASSIHFHGQEATNAVDVSREHLANFLGSAPQEVVFTGGATESNNLAIQGVIREFKKNNPEIVPEVVISPIEHDSVLETVKNLGKNGLIKISYASVDSEGLVLLDDLDHLINNDTVLVSIMYANNEIGTIEPISQIGQMIKNKNESRANKIIFHTDAVQAAGYLDCNVAKLGVDLLSLSGHKIYGPKGVSALYIKKGTPIEPIIFGGGQEYGKRSGTLNVPAIVGLGLAVEELKNKIEYVEKIKILRDKLVKGVLESTPDSQLNGPQPEHRLPNNANFIFPGAEGESIVIMLDQVGIATSTGSACASKSLEPSHVLLAIGVPKEEAHASLRLTLGKHTTEQEINKVIEVMPGIVSRLREIAGARV